MADLLLASSRVETERPHSNPNAYLAHSHDYTHAPGMSLRELERFLDEIRFQPNWRFDADKEADYYDGNQLTLEKAAELEDRGLAPIIVNLIKPTIDLTLGMEAKTRRDWVVRSETDQNQQLAEALSVKLKEAEDLCRADRACSDSYAAQVKVGLGWCEITRNLDPFLPNYRVGYVHRREIWWDWRAKDPLLQDARWLIRKQWYDKDQVIATFPKYRALIEHAVTGFTEWDQTQAQLDTLLVRAWESARDTSIEDMDWRDTDRQRLCVYEVWYKVWHRGYVMHLPGGRVMEYDDTNPRHKAAIASGQINVSVGVFPKIRLSWWIGPHRIVDVPNPFPFNRFPYIPFFGFREDRTGVPYGIIRTMMSPQDEFNARRRKMMWLLAARRIIGDQDAPFNKDWEAVQQEAARPDAAIKLNPTRINRSEAAFRIEDGGQLAKDQFMVMEDAANRLQSSAGIYHEMLGQGDPSQSGIAIANLVEQGTTTLAEINDNYQLSRRQVGECLLALVKQDLALESDYAVKVKHPGKSPTTVYINQTTEDDQGKVARTNDVTQMRATVVLDDLPATPTFRQQQLQQLTEAVKGLPPELQALVIDLVIESTDLPLEMKNEINERLRRQLGLDAPDLEDMDPKERQKYEEMRKAREEAQALAKREKLAAIEKDEAQAEKFRAEAETVPVKAKADAVSKEREQDIKELDRISRDRQAHQQMQMQAAENAAGSKPKKSAKPAQLAQPTDEQLDSAIARALQDLRNVIGNLSDQVAEDQHRRERARQLLGQYIRQTSGQGANELLDRLNEAT